MKKILLVLAVLATGITCYFMWNKPHQDVKDADALKISAIDLYNTFITDSAKAKSAYTDKVLLVSGEVNRVSLNQQGQQVVLIKTDVTGAFINCTMEEEKEILKTGDDITIKAVCNGYISGDTDMGLPGDVFLTRGYLLNGK